MISPLRPSRGFTLVELLVALMLLSLIALGLGGAMRSISQTQERVDLRVEQFERQHTAVRFLRSTLVHLSQQRRTGAQARPNENPYYFVGQPQEMQWLGAMPASIGGGGRTLFRLSLQPGTQGVQLILQYKKWEKSANDADWSSASSYVLASNVQTFSLSYQRTSHRDGLQWLPAWDIAQLNGELPSSVGLQLITSDEGAWPLTLLGLRQPMAGGAAQGGHVIGGSH